MEWGNGKGVERLTAKSIESWLKNPGKGPVKKLADGGGLYLVRLPSGGASWQIKYSLAGAERTYSVGPASSTSLATARAERKRVKDEIKQGIDPVRARRVERAATISSSGELFEDLALAWLKKEQAGWSGIHHEKSKRAIERDVLPYLGDLPVAKITPAMVSKVIERIQNRGVRETAGKVLQHVRSIFKYAAAKGLRTDNPAEPVSEILRRPDSVRHHPALLTFPELGEALRRAEVAQSTRLTGLS